ncbi:MAG TPA: prepilin-type N-terminal cleavage/methylation domain-containing protein [Fimbriimonas sp.]|nr:prepilin-type N-terminal cleavage/methylation domain-containing protein [Fimbriimonas sp.]
MKSAFTLIELLVVIAIIAILAALLFPVFLAARAAAYEWNAGSTIEQVNRALTMYSSDYDDTLMPAMYWDGPTFHTWFGVYKGPSNYDSSQGLLASYEKSKKLHDPTYQSKPYLGDGSGFGYNWGFLGSDFSITGDYSGFPQCHNISTNTAIGDPSNTIILATSSYYFAPWLKKGDGQTYDFGFIDPVSYCHGNPNVDFRHIDHKIVDTKKHTIKCPGNALIAFADGHTKVLKIGQVKDAMFYRTKPGNGTELDGSQLPK